MNKRSILHPARRIALPADPICPSIPDKMILVSHSRKNEERRNSISDDTGHKGYCDQICLERIVACAARTDNSGFLFKNRRNNSSPAISLSSQDRSRDKSYLTYEQKYLLFRQKTQRGPPRDKHSARRATEQYNSCFDLSPASYALYTFHLITHCSRDIRFVSTVHPLFQSCRYVRVDGTIETGAAAARPLST
ncbi:hypothetical protein EVAR_21929_1 [Eumeta japonica]|uniref:Uncharacterized protein n=1 Tax=Eumeta variegata TaxID=151549 RepID=A0A4C1XJV4_EUMVA|nr:hypothetical protein EVAR_21929_1 [Eumeta japonica]